jgi:hypothetical protein
VLRHGRNFPFNLKGKSVGESGCLATALQGLRHFLVVQNNKLLFAHAFNYILQTCTLEATRKVKDNARHEKTFRFLESVN